MALVACKECGKEISKKAEACPHCGFKPKRTSLLTWIVTIFIGVPMLLGIVIGAGNSDSSSGSSTSQAAPEKTPEQLAAEKKHEELRLRALLGGATLKKAMRNPESFKVESALAMEATGAVCYEYRAQNGFGGMNVENAVLTPSGEFKNSSMDGFTKLWNKNCANQSGYDYAKYIR